MFFTSLRFLSFLRLSCSFSVWKNIREKSRVQTPILPGSDFKILMYLRCAFLFAMNLNSSMPDIIAEPITILPQKRRRS